MHSIRKAAIAAALVGSTLTGGAIGATLLGTAGADTSTSSTTAASSAAPSAAAPTGTPGPRDPSQGGHQANGITEALLTGDTADKAKAAAIAAVPGATIERVENDAEGAVYEAHIVKSDGSHATVKMDASFNVTGVEEGH